MSIGCFVSGFAGFCVGLVFGPVRANSAELCTLLMLTQWFSNVQLI